MGFSQHGFPFTEFYRLGRTGLGASRLQAFGNPVPTEPTFTDLRPEAVELIIGYSERASLGAITATHTAGFIPNHRTVRRLPHRRDRADRHTHRVHAMETTFMNKIPGKSPVVTDDFMVLNIKISVFVSLGGIRDGRAKRCLRRF
jgi:hypothetical protein